MTVPVTLMTLLSIDGAPVELAALLIAEDEKPGLDVEKRLVELDRLAAELTPTLPRSGALPAHGTIPLSVRGPSSARGANPARAYAMAELLREHLYEGAGFQGNKSEYYDPRNSYLDDVLERRTGIPLTLAIVLIAVGRRAGITVDGVGFPGHFLARVGGPGGVFVDPFSGRILDDDAIANLGRRVGLAPGEVDRHLRPATTRSMIVRMLANLQNAHERRGDHARALVVCDRLYDLTGAPEHRRDRGLHALALGSFEAAREDLAAYLDSRPRANDAPAVLRAASKAEKQRHALLA